MNAMRRVARRLVTGLGVGGLAFLSLGTWHKHDFCRGWADHYASQAAQRRNQAVEPGLSEEQRREYFAAANLAELISAKYGRVARQPWRAYPGYPLVTPLELQAAKASGPPR